MKQRKAPKATVKQPQSNTPYPISSNNATSASSPSLARCVPRCIGCEFMRTRIVSTEIATAGGMYASVSFP